PLSSQCSPPTTIYHLPDASLFFFLPLRPPPTSTLFPYTTLFRSLVVHVGAIDPGMAGLPAGGPLGRNDDRPGSECRTARHRLPPSFTACHVCRSGRSLAASRRYICFSSRCGLAV